VQQVERAVGIGFQPDAAPVDAKVLPLVGMVCRPAPPPAEGRSTGYGVIHHHVADKDDLLAAAAEQVIDGVTTGAIAAADDPRTGLRALALGLFDAIDAHPGSARTSPTSRGGPRCWTSTRASAAWWTTSALRTGHASMVVRV
jgi:hypothetical protein